MQDYLKYKDNVIVRIKSRPPEFIVTFYGLKKKKKRKKGGNYEKHNRSLSNILVFK